MGKKKYDLEFAKKLFEENGYELLETEYLGYSKRMRFKCPHHPNDDTRIVFSVLLKGGKCKKCADENSAKARRLNINQVRDEFEEKGYILLEEKYENNNTPLKYICKKHDDEEQYATYMNFRVSENSCKHCYLESQSGMFRLDITSVKKMFDSKGYTLIDENQYVNAHKKVDYTCSKHPDKIQKASYNKVKYGTTCEYCDKENRDESNSRRHTFEFVKDTFDSLGYELLETEYKNCDEKLQYICPNHKNHIQQISFYKLYKEGNRCPMCRESKGEKKISEILDSKNVIFKTQYKFEDCKNEKSLPFDFAIFDRDNKLEYLIEYQGEQHYMPIEYMGGEEKFKTRQKRDLIKRNYCFENNIKLLEIPYWEFDNIEKIIDELLDNL